MALNAVVSLTRGNARAIYVADSFMYTRHMCNESAVGVYTRILVLNECACALKRIQPGSDAWGTTLAGAQVAKR